MHAALTANHLEIVKLLLLKRARTDIPDHEGVTTEQLAKNSGIDLKELLFQALKQLQTAFTTTFNTRLYKTDLIISSQQH